MTHNRRWRRRKVREYNRTFVNSCLWLRKATAWKKNFTRIHSFILGTYAIECPFCKNRTARNSAVKVMPMTMRVESYEYRCDLCHNEFPGPAPVPLKKKDRCERWSWMVYPRTRR